jgi:hypothetical protein
LLHEWDHCQRRSRHSKHNAWGSNSSSSGGGGCCGAGNSRWRNSVPRKRVIDVRTPHTHAADFLGWEFAAGRGTRNERQQAEGQNDGAATKISGISVVEAFVGTQSEARVTATASQKHSGASSTTGWLIAC